MGRFSVEFEVANYGDIVRAMDGTLRQDQVRRQTVSGVVDPGAAKLADELFRGYDAEEAARAQT